MRSSSNSRSKAQSSYSISHASKIKAKEPAESAGKMTKFRNLDDIPDTFPDSVEFSGSNNYSSGDKDDLNREYDNYKVSSPKCEREKDFDAYGIRQAVACMKVTPVAHSGGKAPPLPYDSIKIPKEANIKGHVPVPPNNKYFDYDNGAEDFDDDETSASPLGGAEFIPPLPCESKSGKPGAGQEDSIYFSKKPRPVNFK